MEAAFRRLFRTARRRDWAAEFEAYKRIPQYAAMNADMTLDGFKSIFWWEWGRSSSGASNRFRLYSAFQLCGSWPAACSRRSALGMADGSRLRPRCSHWSRLS